MATKILIRTPNHLGDCIMAMPMINDAREAYPDSHVTVMVPESFAELFESNPAIDRLWKVPNKHLHGLIAVKKITDIVSKDKFDIGFVLPPSFGAASSFKLGGVKERIGYIADGRRLLLSKPLALPTPLNSEHRSQLYYSLLRRGAGVELEYNRPKLFLNEDDASAAVEILSGFGIAEDESYATISCRAVAESRRWGTQNYADLARKIVARYGIKIVLVGGPDDLGEGEKIVADVGMKDVFNLAGKTSLRESAAVISLSKFFIGNDSGPAHLAAAVGVPLIVLSGADDPKETSPMSNSKSLVYLDHLECISCVKNVCKLKGEEHMQCMKGISVEDVFAAVTELVPE